MDKPGYIINEFDNRPVKIYGDEADQFAKDNKSAWTKMKKAKELKKDCDLSFREAFAFFGTRYPQRDETNEKTNM